MQTKSTILTSKPRTLLFDVENAPALGYFYDLWKEGNIVSKLKEGYFLSVAYKWLGEKTQVIALPDYKGYKPNTEDDEKLIRDLWKLFDEADIIVAHNGDQFDIKKSNARFTYYKLPPPSPYKTIDTLKVARRYFNFTSNKLNDLAQHLGYGQKVVHTGVHLWLGCMAGDSAAWHLMQKYNKHDVDLLEKIYLHFQPWITNHPNLSDGQTCPKCGSANLRNKGPTVTNGFIYTRYTCRNCGGNCRSPITQRQFKPLLNA